MIFCTYTYLEGAGASSQIKLNTIETGIAVKKKTICYRSFIRYLMATGFALLTISPLHEKEVYEVLDKKINEIVEVHPLFGEYDILLKIETADIDSIGDVVINKVRSLKGVTDTKTLIGTKSLSGGK